MPGLATPTATEREYVTRFGAAERMLHWLLAITFAAMLATGLILALPSLAEVAANRVLWKSIHLTAAVTFWAGLIALIPGNTRELRGTARDVDRFDEIDAAWLRWAVTRHGAEPGSGRFNAGQKLNTAIVAGLMVVFTISGSLMYSQERDASFRGTSAILVHDWATWISIPLIAGHLYLSLIHPSTRHSLRGITLGTVRRDWARRHHARWDPDA
jgi:formate dehydrogenase subunit gamma